VGNEENKHLVPDPSWTMINIINELNDIHKKISQRGNHGWAYWDTHGEVKRIVKQNVQNEFQQYQDTTNKQLIRRHTNN
jgi:hypothetical protein